MRYLEKMSEAGIPVNWLTIQVGWDGPGEYSRLLSIAEVASYAIKLIEDDSEQSAEVQKLAAAYDGEEHTVDTCVRKLASGENGDLNTELRKWRLVLLEDYVETLGEDPLYGLLNLTEFWARFDYPADSPHTVQGRDDRMSPQDYYTLENYQLTLETHRQWIKREKSLLTQSGKD